ncbi:dihydroxyacetone phosphate acyltransferase [Synchiropus splendidus]|uniref:dihydroxyacetone phosphate acyltransferase n=1 Tax=Synchiropus splendidus TaxID=270530 RepID=UPI00237E0439|nr:dihydroxyacetone phosphate acyltransferase [Synchiropus splendidus]
MPGTFLESSCTGLNSGQYFVDLLEERRSSSDLGHALRTYNPQPYKDASSCSPAEINEAVLDSQNLRYVMKEIAAETGVATEELKVSARGILEEMSQNLQLRCIRLMAFTLTKVVKRLFSNIYINMEGLSMLQQAIQESPVILMPNHRSYVDFLIISYILFTYDLPVPVIAAGIPLAGMKVVGEILRRSGAFFIRRDIGADKLYWAVLSEYVKVLVRRGCAPLEFYVEGYRSRALKSLTPKLGMMHMVLEPFFKGEVYDVTLVPISISYDRVLEESLLAHELLGVPKPKESTRGLLKATGVLEEDYGCMHVTFCRPLSVRELCYGRISRWQYNLTPRDLPQRPSLEAQACVSWLAHLVLRTQEGASWISPWSLMAHVLLQTPTAVLAGEGLPWHQLMEKTLWLKKLALDLGAQLNWPAQVPDSEVVTSSLALHHSTVQHRAGHVSLAAEEEPTPKCPASPEERVIRTAVPLLMLASYRNQSMHVFVRPALLATAMRVTESTRRDEIFAFFCFLQHVFSAEFIFIPGQASQDFDEACLLLKKCAALEIKGQELTVSDAGGEVLHFLRSLLLPFIQSYEVMLRYLCEGGGQQLSDKTLLPAVRSLATKLILSGELGTYEALSSDAHKNALSALRRLEAVTKLRPSERSEYRVDTSAVRRIRDVLSGKIPPQTLQAAPDARL